MGVFIRINRGVILSISTRAEYLYTQYVPYLSLMVNKSTIYTIHALTLIFKPKFCSRRLLQMLLYLLPLLFLSIGISFAKVIPRSPYIKAFDISRAQGSLESNF
jgi:hypothetical protein